VAAKSAAQRAEYFKGLHVIRDTVEIDELQHADDSITIEDCFGFVLIEVSKHLRDTMPLADIQDRAEELADESRPYGISELSWSVAISGNGSFIRFEVEEWEQISQADRDQDAQDIKAEERYEASREVSLG